MNAIRFKRKVQVLHNIDTPSSDDYEKEEKPSELATSIGLNTKVSEDVTTPWSNSAFYADITTGAPRLNSDSSNGPIESFVSHQAAAAKGCPTCAQHLHSSSAVPSWRDWIICCDRCQTCIRYRIKQVK